MTLPITSSIIFRNSILLLLIIGSPCLFSQKPPDYRVAFYNLENLFYPEDDSLKRDGDFTPEGKRNWSYYRYHEKSNHMAKAILSIGEWSAPALVGVAEIENRKVLEDLVQTEVLRKFGYEIIHYESPDRRGIDVGLLYRKNMFTPITTLPIPVSMLDEEGFATRDILYAKGLTPAQDTLHLFVCHWPSRYGGQARSEPKRIQAAIQLRYFTDSLQAYRPDASILVMGDFNDEYFNISLKDSLGAAVPERNTEARLFNLMATLPKVEGSHRYRGTWAYLDQVIVSSSLLDGQGMDIKAKKAHVTQHPFLLETDDRYPGKVPFRTFIGLKYNGGFSDHLPVYVDLMWY